jgi:hypothetical protein
MNVPPQRRHRVCGAIQKFLRAIGLGFLFSHDEKPKKVLSASTTHIIARNIIHIFPLSALAGILWLNCGRYFIGPTFIQNPEKNSVFMVSIQVCAKLLELLCVASLATIVLQALRHELLGGGIPLGLLGSLEVEVDLAVELVLDMDYAMEVAKQKPPVCPLDCIRTHCRDNRAGVCLSDVTTRAGPTRWWCFVLHERYNRNSPILASDSHS